MQQFLYNLFTKLASYFAPYNPYRQKADELINQISTEDVSGERKRSWVLNNLVDAFPTARVRDLAYVIELIMQESK